MLSHNVLCMGAQPAIDPDGENPRKTWKETGLWGARMLSAALEDVYEGMVPASGKWPARARVMEPSPDDTLTMVRVSRFFSSGYSAWVTRKGPTCAQRKPVKGSHIQLPIIYHMTRTHDSNQLDSQRACLEKGQ